MAVGFSSYQIARSGLTVSERGLNVTGQNISNVDTTGYVRQQSISETSQYLTVNGKNNKEFQYGLGADIQETRQIRHTFLDIAYRQENTTLGYNETRSSTIDDVEAILSDPMGDGLQSIMDQFWDSWQELSKAPDSLTTRALVKERSQELVFYFNQVGGQLTDIQNNLNSEVQVQVGEINDITSQIAKLNTTIASNEADGDNANDYRDQRNLLLDKLSKICDAQANEMQDGQVDVTLDGHALVSKGTSKNLYVKATSENKGYYYPMLEGTDIGVDVKSGSLKGLLESRGDVTGEIVDDVSDDPDQSIISNTSKTIVSDLKIQLNSMLNVLVNKVNELSRTGKTLDGADGVDLFAPIDTNSPMQMGNLKLSDDVTSDDGLNNIVASATSDVGDNTIARAIANLRGDDLLEDGSGPVSIDEYYQSIITDIGTKGDEATTAAENQQTLVQAADDQRTAISGVSMDEELSNMMKYKFAYDASARVLNIIDSMVEKVVNSMGTVGR